MNAPRTAREALMAELLGDLDALLARVEALPAVVAESEKAIATTVTVLEAAGDKYRAAVMAFNEQAKADLNDYLDLKSTQIASATAKAIEEQRAAMLEAARAAFYSKEFRRSKVDRVTEHLLTALISSALTATFVTFLLQRH